MRVSFIVSPSYHGSTLLALLLQNHSQISSTGDGIPPRGSKTKCSCGQRVNECEFWQTISARGPAMLPALPRPLTRHRLEGYPTRVFHNARFDRLAGRAAAAGGDRVIESLWRRSQIDEFVDLYRSFYKLTLDLQGTSVFVDGSKNWRPARLLARELGPDGASIVHLVRDPRGFAVSQRARGLGGRDLRAAAWLWADLHGRMRTLEQAAPYRVLRYEDLCAQPEDELASLVASLGLAPENVVAPARHPAKGHLIGNPMRKDFDGTVQLDERWRSELSDAEQRTVLAAAGDLAARFGYTL